VPDHIDVPIRDWLYEVLRHYDMATPVAVRLRSCVRTGDP
jgi:hypothetical protein